MRKKVDKGEEGCPGPTRGVSARVVSRQCRKAVEVSHLCDGVGVVSDDGGVLAALCHSKYVALDEMTDADVLGRWQTIVDEQTEVVDETTQVA